MHKRKRVRGTVERMLDSMIDAHTTTDLLACRDSNDIKILMNTPPDPKQIAFVNEFGELPQSNKTSVADIRELWVRFLKYQIEKLEAQK